MMHLRPRRKEIAGKSVIIGYAIEVYDPLRQPKRKWVSLKTKSKQAAQAKFARYEIAYARGEWDPWNEEGPDSGLTVSDAVERYLADATDLRPSSRRSSKIVLEQLASSLNTGFPLIAVEARHVKRILRPDLADSSRNTYHARLGAFFNWCVKAKLIKSSPIVKIKKPRVGRKEVEFLTEEQYEKLLEAVEGHARHVEEDVARASLKEGEVRWMSDIIKVAVGTGMRLGELCQLRWSAVDLKTKSIRVGVGFETKSGHQRTVFLAGDALAVITRLSASKRGLFVFRSTATRAGVKGHVDERYVSRRFKKYAEKAGLPERFTFHTLRHTFASWLVMKGVDLYTVQKLLGHASIETTMRYAHLRPDKLRADVERVFEKVGATNVLHEAA